MSTAESFSLAPCLFVSNDMCYFFFFVVFYVPLWITDANTPKKCRALFGLDQLGLWCKPCRRKKKCIRYIQGEGSCASPPSSDGSLLESPPSSPFMVSPSPSSKESKAQTEQMQPLSLTMKPPPLLSSSQHQHLSMAPPPPLARLDNSGTGKTSGSAHNGSLDLSDVSSSRPTGSASSRPTLACHSHSLLPSSATTQPLSLVTKSID